MRTLVIVNQSSVQIPANFVEAMNKFSALVAIHWGNQVEVVLATAIPSNSWAIVLKDQCDVAGALGYHTVSNTGVPIGYIGVGTCIAANVPWTSCFAHELAEMMADCFCQWMATNNVNGWMYPREICDPVENNTFTIDGIVMSDFVFQEWFSPATAEKFDYLGVLKSAFTLAPEGYVSAVENGVYTTVWGDKVKDAVKKRVHSRLETYGKKLAVHLPKTVESKVEEPLN